MSTRRLVRDLFLVALLGIFLAQTPARPSWFAGFSGGLKTVARLADRLMYKVGPLGWTYEGATLDAGITSADKLLISMDWGRLTVPNLSQAVAAYDLTLAGTAEPNVTAIRLSPCGRQFSALPGDDHKFVASIRVEAGCF